NNRARPPSNTRQNRDVLPSVRSFKRDGLADNSGTGLELPQKLARVRIDSFEPTLHRSVEHDIACSRKRSAPNGEHVGIAPDNFSCDRVPPRECATVSAGSLVHP